MQRDCVIIRWSGGERRCDFTAPVQLSELAGLLNIPLSMPCGGCRGCGRCAVKISGELSPPDEAERSILGEKIEEGWRLACRVGLMGDCVITLQDVPELVFEKTGHPLPEEGDIGAAVDIGTTTVCMALVDMASRKVICRASALNRQRLYGDDVIARIDSCEREGLDRLHSMISEQISLMMSECAERCGVHAGRIKRMAVAGNTVMLHIAAGLSPAQMGSAPYEPSERFGRTIVSEQSGLGIDAYFMPCVSGFVGGDLVACLVAGGLPDKALLCDLGTNGEIALRCGDKIYTTSAAAGPALEGGGIECGSGPVKGAASRIFETDDGVAAEVIGGGEALTLSGPAIISAVAMLLDRGIIAPSGFMESERFDLCGKTYLTAKDVRMVQLSKGALAASMLCIAEAAGLPPGEIEEVIVTGGLGCWADIGAVREIGLIHEQITCPVSSRPALALEGAVSCLYEEGQRLAERLVEKCRPVVLSENESFMDLFIKNMRFPGAGEEEE